MNCFLLSLSFGFYIVCRFFIITVQRTFANYTCKPMKLMTNNISPSKVFSKNVIVIAIKGKL